MIDFASIDGEFRQFFNNPLDISNATRMKNKRLIHCDTYRFKNGTGSENLRTTPVRRRRWQVDRWCGRGCRKSVFRQR